MPQSENASFLQVLKRIAREERESADLCNVLIGTVTSANPLKIKISQKIVLDEDFLVLSRNVTDYNTDVSLDVNTDSVSIAHTHSVSIVSDSALGSHSHSYSTESGEAGEKPHSHPVSGETSSVTLSHTHSVNGSTGSAGGSHSHKVKGTINVIVHNALKAGDTVLLLRQNGGQNFIVLDRIGD
jgi:hypothetical protein